MRRTLATLAALFGVLGATFIAAPPALAYRDTGWYVNNCADIYNTVWVYERVQWWASDNHRLIDVVAYFIQGPGGPGGTRNYLNYISFQSKLVGSGTWQEYASQTNPDPNATWEVNRTPTVNPGDAHLWLARGNDGFINCDLYLEN